MLGRRIGGSLNRVYQEGDLVRGRFVDHSDRYPNGQPKHKEYVGLVVGVFTEEGYGAYRVKVLIQGVERWAMDYSLSLVEAA